MRTLTASALDRVERCALSAVLPPVVDISPAPWRDAGTAVHDYLRRVLFDGPAKALASVPEAHRALCEAIDLETIHGAKPDAWAAEVALAWHPGSNHAAELHRGKATRDYSLALPGAICGTADMVGMTQHVGPVVLDLKTGWADLGPPEASLQLGFAAVALCRIYGHQEATVGFVRLINGEGVCRTAHLDLFALEAMEARLRAVANSAAAAELVPEAVTPVIGPHCRYCPAFLRCPAQMGLARELAYESTLSAELPPLTPSNFPQVLNRLEAGESLLKRIRDHVDAYATAHPVHLPDGRIYGQVERSRETFDASKARPVLAGLGLSAAIETEESLTKASLKRAIGKAGMARGAEKGALEALRKAGAAVEKTYAAVDYISPKRLGGGEK